MIRTRIRAVPSGAVFICRKNRHILDNILMIRRQNIYGSYFFAQKQGREEIFMQMEEDEAGDGNDATIKSWAKTEDAQ